MFFNSILLCVSFLREQESPANEKEIPALAGMTARSIYNSAFLIPNF